MARELENSGNAKPNEPTSQVSNLWAYLDEIELQRSGSRSPEVIVSFLAALLMLRWVEHAEAETENGADPYVWPVLTGELKWSSWSSLRGDQLVAFLGIFLTPSLAAVPDGVLGEFLPRLGPVFRHLALESPTTIEILVQWAQEFDMETPSGRQAAADALSTLVEQTTRMRGEFTTPRPVVELMVDLLDPGLGERIYDPCFGSGGLLAAAAGRLREKAMQMPPQMWAEIQQDSLFGIEINPFTYSIGLARVVLAGIGRPELQLGNTLETPLPEDRDAEEFDCILAVPPWGARVGPGTGSNFPVSAANVETLFLQHVMGSLCNGGRAVIALPDGVLFRTGPDQRVRKKLLTDYCVEGVVSLPAGAFRPYTGIKGSLVCFRREQAKERVRFSQIETWATPSVGDTLIHDRMAALAHRVAEEFRSKIPNDNFWETPIEKLANTGWSLVAKPTGEESLSRSLKALHDTGAEIPVRPLHEVANLFPGISYRKAETTPHRDDPSAFAGLLRVADVTRASVQTPSLYLTREGSQRVKSKHRLCAGDVIVTATGTIGRLGVVSESSGVVGAVPTKNLVIIRPKRQMSAEFLKRLLSSDTYQEWFRGHAQGNVIQYLPVQTLRNLPVPVPEMAFQERVARRKIEERGGSLAAIVRILTDGSSDDPIVTWLEESSEGRELMQPQEGTDSATLLGRTAHSIRMLRNQVVHSRIRPMPDLSQWLMHLSEAAEMLEGLNHVPPGSGRMAILDGAQLRLERAQSVLGESHLQAVDFAEQATKRISQVVRSQAESLLKDVKLELWVEPGAVVVGTENEVQVHIRNLSSLALRNISVSTSPNVGSTQVMYLPKGQALSFAAQIPALTKTGAFPFLLRWRANRIDGQLISREVPLAVDVRYTKEANRRGELGTSPYIVGSPIDREEMFYGRQNIIDRIRRQLSTSHRANVILLEGNRRTGKTSILTRLQAPDILAGWIVVNCSFQSGEGHGSKAGLSTNEVFRLMARNIGWAVDDAGLRVWFPDMEPPDSKKPFKVAFVRALTAAFSGSTRPFEVFELYLQAVLQAASPRRLLLMLDEFDKLQEGIDTGITSPQVPENIRYLLHQYPDLSAILTGSRRLKRLREEYWSALFGFGHRIPVSELPLEDARLLVTQPVDGRLFFVPEATEQIVELCGRQPFLIQSLCNRIFEQAAISDERTVTVSAVNEAAYEMVTDNEHFRTLWGYAETERRRFVLTMCQNLKDGADPITLRLLETKFEEHGIVLPRSYRLGEDLEFLRELELLELGETTRGSAYGFAVPLMADWIRRNIDFEDQRQQAVQESEEDQ